MSLTPDLKALCITQGADLVEIAKLESFKKGLWVLPEMLLDPYIYATRSQSVSMICSVCITVCPFGKKTKRPAIMK